MAVIRITGEGLAAISLSVALLWGCFLGEQATLRSARTERARVMYEMRELQRQQQAQPVSVPAPRVPRPVRSSAG